MIQIVEYAIITDNDKASPSITCAVVDSSTFNWLLHLKSTWSGDEHNDILELCSKNTIRFGSYVGYMQSPSGKGIEILPKIYGNDAEKARKILIKMLNTILRTTNKNAGDAKLRNTNLPLMEWIFQQFLEELTLLLKIGIKSDYIYLEEESNFIKGRLDIIKQLRQSPDKRAQFHVKYDKYYINRLENRLIRNALEYVLRYSSNTANRRKANEYNQLLHEITPLQNPQKEIDKWSKAKDMNGYEAIKPWCETIINKLSPFFQKGKHQGIAVLFPMEQIFENYVTACFKNAGCKIKTQCSSEYLVTHDEKSMFPLRPDILTSEHVIDIKWKILDIQNNHYGMSNTDMRQMFAYGHSYICGSGNMMLIYPMIDSFKQPIGHFKYTNNNLSLWAVPFDLESSKLVNNNTSNLDKIFYSLANIF